MKRSLVAPIALLATVACAASHKKVGENTPVNAITDAQSEALRRIGSGPYTGHCETGKSILTVTAESETRALLDLAMQRGEVVERVDGERADMIAQEVKSKLMTSVIFEAQDGSYTACSRALPPETLPEKGAAAKRQAAYSNVSGLDQALSSLSATAMGWQPDTGDLVECMNAFTNESLTRSAVGNRARSTAVEMERGKTVSTSEVVSDDRVVTRVESSSSGTIDSWAPAHYGRGEGKDGEFTCVRMRRSGVRGK